MQSYLASAIFDTRAEAERAVTDLRVAGVPDSALSIIAQGDAGTTGEVTGGDAVSGDEHHTNIVRGILGGGALGAGLGIAALAIPGVGPLVAAGAIAASAIPGAAAIGVAAGAVAGTLNETLTKHGVNEEDAAYYGERFGNGGVFVSVDTGSGAVSSATAEDILSRNGGHSANRARAAAL
jgi:hypothetical protein